MSARTSTPKRLRRGIAAAGIIAAALTAGAVAPAMADPIVAPSFDLDVPSSVTAGAVAVEFTGHLDAGTDPSNLFVETEIYGDDAAAGYVHLDWYEDGTWKPMPAVQIDGGIRVGFADGDADQDDITGFTPLVLPYVADTQFRISVDADAAGGDLSWTSTLMSGVDASINGTVISSTGGDVTVNPVDDGGEEPVGDETAPEITLTSTPAEAENHTTTPDVTFGWSATDDDTNLTYAWEMDGGDFSTPSTATTVSYTGLSDDWHTFGVKAIDSAGNESETVYHQFLVQTPAVPGPAIAFTGTPAASSTSTSAHFTVSAPAGTTFGYVLDLPEGAQSASPEAASADFTLTGLSVGHHTIRIVGELNGGWSALDYAWDVTSSQVLAPNAIPAAMVNRGIKRGASGPSVAIIQSIVGTPADGKFGSKTLAAVRAFQRAHGLVADGIVGPLTWAAIVDVANGGTGVVPVTAKSVPAAQIARGIKQGSSAQAVSAVQRVLGVPSTGKFDAKTKAAVKAFQAAHGLKVDGIVGPITWGVLVKH